jgi:RimJ/RimL family protein N-acetyltransferase
MDISYRKLQPANSKAYHKLLLQGLKDEPSAFGSSYEEALSQPPEKWLMLDHNNVAIGAFANEQLIGTVGLYRKPLKKLIHNVFIKAMYLLPEYRDQGIGKGLLDFALQYAQNEMKAGCVKLWVVKDEDNTFQFYEKCGLRVYATEPKAIKINGRFVDEYLMWRDFS